MSKELINKILEEIGLEPIEANESLNGKNEWNELQKEYSKLF